jgi:60 kDa SS-A/Ro ribonucleoprotein
MAVNYAKHISTKVTPQSEAIPFTNQIKNSADGYSFPVDDTVRMDRFLILGSVKGSYYAGEQKLTKENAEAVIRRIQKNGLDAVNQIVNVSVKGRAPKNDPAVFALALAATYGDTETKKAAFAAVSKVCRIGTHLFQFANYCNELRGWGRGLKNAIANWYLDKDTDNLAYQVTKYQQRDGWSHRDLLRLSHPKTTDSKKQSLFRWVTHGADSKGSMQVKRGDVTKEYSALDVSFPSYIEGFERIKKVTSVKEAAKLVAEYNLPRECVPTQFLTEKEIWEVLLEKGMPLTALIRNLGNMTKIGLISPLSKATRKVVEILSNSERLKKSRIHPFSVLVALKAYSAGRGFRGSSTWSPVSAVTDALDSAFYKCFDFVKPTNKRWLVAVDCSGSMGSPEVAGLTGINPRTAAAALAMVIANTEPNNHIVGFTSGGYSSRFSGYGSGLTELNLSKRQRLDDVINTMSRVPFGGTDCALPMLYAEQKKIEVDVFVVLTDSETWHGSIHPTQALQNYRKVMGIPAKSAVVGMVSNGFSIADPEDAGQMDFVGCDSALPSLLQSFVDDNYAEELPEE